MITAPSSTSCPNATIWRSSCKRRDCPVCGPRWARDQARVLKENLGSVDGSLAMVTITAPGEERLPWDVDHCAHRKRHNIHRGKDGCRVQQRAAREWSETASLRLGMLRRAAVAAVKRSAKSKAGNLDGGHARVFVVDSAGEAELVAAVPGWLNRTWEPQKRGVPHAHIVLPYGTALERVAAHALVFHLKRLAPEYDFGFVDARGKKKPKDDDRPRARVRSMFGVEVRPVVGEDAARYLASYLSGRSKHKGSIRQNLVDPAMSYWAAPRKVVEGSTSSTIDTDKMARPRRIALPLVWTSPRLTKKTLVTMRTLRRARHLWASWGGKCDVPNWSTKGPMTEAVKVAAVFRRIYPKRAGPLGDIAGALAFAADIDRRMRSPELVLTYEGWQVPRQHNRDIARMAFLATAA